MLQPYSRRFAHLVLALPNAAEFLTDVDALRATGATGADFEDGIVKLALGKIGRMENRHQLDGRQSGDTQTETDR